MTLSADTLTALSFLMAAISFVFASVGSRARNELDSMERLVKKDKCDVSSVQKRSVAIACWASAFPCAAFLIAAALSVAPAIVCIITTTFANLICGYYNVEMTIVILFYILTLYLAAYSIIVFMKAFSAWLHLCD